MAAQNKAHTRKRVVVGWRELERKRLDVRARHRPPPVRGKPSAG